MRLSQDEILKLIEDAELTMAAKPKAKRTKMLEVAQEMAQGKGLELLL